MSPFTTSPNLLYWNASTLLDQAMQRLALALKAYNPNQERAPEGTREGGQWISPDTELTPVVLAGGFEKVHMGMMVRDFVSKFCVGKTNREVSGQFWGLTIEELLQAKRDGVPMAGKCYKLLNENRFR